MPVACPECGVALPDLVEFCPSCGIAIATGATARSTQLEDKILGALAYCTFVPPVVLLLSGRFNRSRFVRFHSYQSIFLVTVALVGAIAMRLIFSLLDMIPRLGDLFAWLAVALFCLAQFVLWLVLLAKALQGEFFKLPLIGSPAAKQAGV